MALSKLKFAKQNAEKEKRVSCKIREKETRKKPLKNN
jgi:hypothetical protein